MSFIKKTDEKVLKKHYMLLARIQKYTVVITAIVALVFFILALVLNPSLFGILAIISIIFGVIIIDICEVIRAAISKELFSRKRELTIEKLSSNKVSQIILEKFNHAPGDRTVKNQILSKVLNDAKIEAEYNKEDNSITLAFRFTDNSFTITVEEGNLINHIKFI